MSKEIHLITRADDGGSNHTANIAIYEACQKGIVKNISLMATCSAIEEAARMFEDLHDVCFGVHLTMNAEWDNIKWGSVLPVERVSTLVDESGFFSPTVSALKARGVKVDEVFAEMTAQLNRLRELGFAIAYADEHMFFGNAIEGFSSIFDAWCQAEGLLNHRHYQRELPKIVQHDAMNVEHFINTISAAPSGQYVVIGHPAYDTEEMRALGHAGYEGDVVATSRDMERKLFMDYRVLKYFKSNQVVPIRYDEAVEISKAQELGQRRIRA
ncbi:ChbG/HpnK family deacetylase [Alicyclobacillus fodiniaquatilis]|jgi:predicted glycoside hydrolase/deacetylase ChbG (UPF0249 family)|uniref:ChbG/HpnK family deacetylase n=1 Tax=Alicyclobacillus fodiniaquatilis TaxID=1661150 RepID=A0ABW4JNT5_9BACL